MENTKIYFYGFGFEYRLEVGPISERKLNFPIYPYFRRPDRVILSHLKRIKKIRKYRKLFLFDLGLDFGRK